jgi:non-specific serine/threonine protein kinase/serine/threonine-protein kinase
MIDREEVVDELFAQAVELDPSRRREFFAERAAVDQSLISDGVLDEVNALLGDYERAEEESFLRKPLVTAQPEDEPAHTLEAGQQLKGYTILRLIDEGGMGEVYLARDAELNRPVAIKLIKGNLKTKEVLRRFFNERQILANLQHKNIAKLLEAGATSDGLPFFVMEYVEGQPIDRYADENRLSITQRLKLFRTVCSAVSYAHQNLIIHRDIKPSNILVTRDGEPTLLDFGISKLLQASDSPKPDVTVTVLRVMTPEYASPEQIKGEPVTTATDVYGLGVLLYELLTGHRPYRLKRRSVEEITRAVREQEPERPSTAIRRNEESSDSIHLTTPQLVSETREGEPARLRRRLRGDLDNIALKALSKEPQRRYASVEQFSEDIRRHLEGLPVIARKDTLKYRASKFVSRNRVAAAAAAVIFVTLVGGIIATAWEAHAARVERARAEQRFNEVRKLAHSFLFDYHDAIADLPGATPVRRRLVNDALEYLNSLSQEASGDASLRRELAAAYLKVGDVQGRPYRSNLGETEGALVSYRKALAILEPLSAGDPSNVELRRELAAAYDRIGTVQLRRLDLADSLEKNTKALAIREALFNSDPTNADYRRDLAESYIDYGDIINNASLDPSREESEVYREALEVQRKALELREALSRENPSDLQARRDLAQAYSRVGFRLTGLASHTDGASYLRQSLEHHRKALALSEEIAKAASENARDRRNLADQYMILGDAQVGVGDTAGALDGYRRAVAIFKSLLSSDPSNKEALLDASFAYNKLANALTKTGDAAAAQENELEALHVSHRLLAADPANQEAVSIVADAQIEYAHLLEQKGDFTGATENWRAAIETEEEFGAPTPSHRRTLAGNYTMLGALYARAASIKSVPRDERVERWREARDWFQKSLNVWRDLRDKGLLSGTSAAKPDEVSKEIAVCDAALEKLKAD